MEGGREGREGEGGRKKGRSFFLSYLIILLLYLFAYLLVFHQVWNYYVFPETHEFLNWKESVPPYAQTAAEGIPNEAYVHTVQNEVQSLLVSRLSIS